LLKNTVVKKDTSKKTTLLITGQHLKRAYDIQAKSEPDLENWIRELQNVINKTNNSVIVCKTIKI
jgi:serum/glucocorticoid-regulated kinase 2